MCWLAGWLAGYPLSIGLGVHRAGRLGSLSRLAPSDATQPAALKTQAKYKATRIANAE
jgi:hypothetical protein